jgi:hypothetical protein
MSEVDDVYNGSDGDATKALYVRLSALGPGGVVAMNLLRTCKASERAKKYRGRAGRGQPSYRSMAYEKKDWSIAELCRALVVAADDLGISWGWGRDEKAIGFEDVLYIDLPGSGQVSFHTSYRRDGPDYAGKWDGARDVAPRRIIAYAQFLMNGGEHVAPNDRPEGSPATSSSEAEAGTPERQQTLDL